MLSDRLEAVYDLIPRDSVVVDVGTDHGYLPIELTRRGKAKRAIASDVLKGPLSAARRNVANAGCEDKITCVLSDGLKSVAEFFDCVVLAGLGGRKIIKILSESRDKLQNVADIIVQANSNVAETREYITKELPYFISDEKLILENDVYYEIIRFCRGKENYTPIQYRFGPRLLEENSPLLAYKIKADIAHDKFIYQKIPASQTERREKFARKIKEAEDLYRELRG